MPYHIVKHVEPKAPEIVAKIFSDRPVRPDSIDMPDTPITFMGSVIQIPPPRLRILPESGSPLGGISAGPYDDLEEVRRAVERHTADTCRIIDRP